MDKDIARKTMVRAVRNAEDGAEARLDKGVLSSAFPPGPDDRPLDEQILDYLGGLFEGEALQCRAVAGGDFVVVRKPGLSKAARPVSKPAPRALIKKKPAAKSPAPTKKASKGRKR